MEEIAAMISLEDLQTAEYLQMFGGITTQRAALSMARIHVHLDNLALAKRFGIVGLENIGSATALKSEFENILNTTQRSA